MSVKIDFSPDYPDFGYFGLFLTGHYLSNYGQELFLAEAFKKAQQPKTFFFSGHENFFRQIDPKLKISYIIPLLIYKKKNFSGHFDRYNLEKMISGNIGPAISALQPRGGLRPIWIQSIFNFKCF